MKTISVFFIILVSSTATFAQQPKSKVQKTNTPSSLNLKAFEKTSISTLWSGFNFSNTPLRPKTSITKPLYNMPVYQLADELKMPTYTPPSSLNYKLIVVNSTGSK